MDIINKDNPGDIKYIFFKKNIEGGVVYYIYIIKKVEKNILTPASGYYFLKPADPNRTCFLYTDTNINNINIDDKKIYSISNKELTDIYLEFLNYNYKKADFVRFSFEQ